MAKDVASRVSGDDASAQEARARIEQAAEQFASIHDRWSALRSNRQPLDASSAEGPSAGGAGQESDALLETTESSELGPGVVSVTPILGIATSDASEPGQRPRFKTLMGVPRNSPDIDALAGIEVEAGRRRDTVRFERPPSPPPPLAPASGAEPARARSSAEPSLAATSWPWERYAPALRQSPRAVPPQWSALVESSLDVSQEVAALRASNGRRPWLVALGALAAVVALFAAGAPRERTLALRWLRQEYQTRVHPSVEAITDTSRALRPTANGVARSSVEESTRATAAPAAVSALAVRAAASAESTPAQGVPAPRSSSAAALTRAGPATLSAAAVPAAAARETASPEETASAETELSAAPAASAPTSMGALAAAAPAPASAEEPGVLDRASAEQASTDRASTDRASTERPAHPHASGAHTKATPSSSNGATPSSLTPHDARTRSGNPSKARQQVAAPRKRSPRPAAALGSATKPRATHQNSPRKDAGDGIIRETPF